MYKSKIFAMLYSSKKELLELYNAVSGRHYEDPKLLEINTLENAIYMSMHNDVSILVYHCMNTSLPTVQIYHYGIYFTFQICTPG